MLIGVDQEPSPINVEQSNRLSGAGGRGLSPRQRNRVMVRYV
jgi:hypothetical protein